MCKLTSGRSRCPDQAGFHKKAATLRLPGATHRGVSLFPLSQSTKIVNSSKRELGSSMRPLVKNTRSGPGNTGSGDIVNSFGPTVDPLSQGRKSSSSSRSPVPFQMRQWTASPALVGVHSCHHPTFVPATKTASTETLPGLAGPDLCVHATQNSNGTVQRENAIKVIDLVNTISLPSL